MLPRKRQRREIRIRIRRTFLHRKPTTKKDCRKTRKTLIKRDSTWLISRDEQGQIYNEKKGDLRSFQAYTSLGYSQTFARVTSRRAVITGRKMALLVVIDHKWYIVLELSLDNGVAVTATNTSPSSEIASQASSQPGRKFNIDQGVYRLYTLCVSVNMSDSEIFTLECDKISFHFPF